MKPRRKLILKQPLAEEVRDACLGLLRSKFYGNSAEELKAFAQDRKLLLKWVVFMPATWLNERGVSIHGDQYRQIFVKVFMQAAAHMESKIKYRPAYLRQVIQSHMAIHGEEYYEEAKSVRVLTEQAILLTGKMPTTPAADPVKQLAQAAALIQVPKRGSKKAIKPTPNLELKLF